ncbi:MAG: hypothetical protein PHE58_02490, partial [Candidatus Omnitrophica bacterium]|nr:hypothetical protein [Candidatus Omnitrophota bacterium]
MQAYKNNTEAAGIADQNLPKLYIDVRHSIPTKGEQEYIYYGNEYYLSFASEKPLAMANKTDNRFMKVWYFDYTGGENKLVNGKAYTYKLHELSANSTVETIRYFNGTTEVDNETAVIAATPADGWSQKNMYAGINNNLNYYSDVIISRDFLTVLPDFAYLNINAVKEFEDRSFSDGNGNYIDFETGNVLFKRDNFILAKGYKEDQHSFNYTKVVFFDYREGVTPNGTAYTYVGHEVNGHKLELYYDEFGKQLNETTEVNDSVVNIPAKEMSVKEIKKIILEHPAWYKNVENVQKSIDDAILEDQVRKSREAELKRWHDERIKVLESQEIISTDSLVAYTKMTGREYAARDAIYRTAEQVENRNKAINSLVGMLSLNNHVSRKEFERGVDQLELQYGLNSNELDDVVSFVERNFVDDVHYSDSLGRNLLTFRKELDSNTLLNIIADNEDTYGVSLKSWRTYLKENSGVQPTTVMNKIDSELSNPNGYLSSSYAGLFGTAIRDGHNEPMLNAAVQAALLNKELKAQNKTSDDLYVGVLFNFSEQNGVIRYSRPMNAVLIHDSNKNGLIEQGEITSLNTERQEGDDYLKFDLSKYNSISFFDVNATEMKLEPVNALNASLPGIATVKSIEGNMKDGVLWDFRDDKVQEYVKVGDNEYNVEDSIAEVSTLPGGDMSRVVFKDGSVVISNANTSIQVRNAAGDYTEISRMGDGLSAKYQHDITSGLWEFQQYDFRDPSTIFYNNQIVDKNISMARQTAAYVVHITRGAGSNISNWKFEDVYYSNDGKEIARDNKNLSYSNLKVNAGNLNKESAAYVIDARFGKTSQGVVTTEGFFMRGDMLSSDVYNQTVAVNTRSNGGYYTALVKSLDTFSINEMTSRLSGGYSGSNILGFPGAADARGPPTDLFTKKPVTVPTPGVVQVTPAENVTETTKPETNVTEIKKPEVTIPENVTVQPTPVAPVIPAENKTTTPTPEVVQVAPENKTTPAVVPVPVVPVPPVVPVVPETPVQETTKENVLSINVSNPVYNSGDGWASVTFNLDQPVDVTPYNMLRLNISGTTDGQQIIVQMLDVSKPTSSDMGASKPVVLKSGVQTIEIPVSEFKFIDLKKIDKITVHYGESAWGKQLNNGVSTITILGMEFFIKDGVAAVTPVADEFENVPAAVVNEQAVAWMKANMGSKGLFISHPNHPEVGNWGFTYDQALGALVMMSSGDRASAEKILDFFAFEAKKGPTTGLYYTGYDVNNGNPVEWNEMVGPTAWVAIAMAWYTEMYNDNRYLSTIENIADSMLALKQANGAIPEGKIAGQDLGKRVYTEHNIDVYVVTKYLAEKTSNNKYAQARDDIANWIVNDMYDGNRLFRGLNENGERDDTLSTDVQAWGASSNIPGLNKKNMLEAGEYNSKVTVSYTKENEDPVNVTGFAFQSAQEMITPEWTAHNALGWLTVDVRRHNFYLNEMEKMRTIEGGLPYASLCDADTLQGWKTPPAAVKASVAGTAYVYLAEKKFDPLNITVKQQAPVVTTPTPEVVQVAPVQEETKPVVVPEVTAPAVPTVPTPGVGQVKTPVVNKTITDIKKEFAGVSFDFSGKFITRLNDLVNQTDVNSAEVTYNAIKEEIKTATINDQSKQKYYTTLSEVYSAYQKGMASTEAFDALKADWDARLIRANGGSYRGDWAVNKISDNEKITEVKQYETSHPENIWFVKYVDGIIVNYLFTRNSPWISYWYGPESPDTAVNTRKWIGSFTVNPKQTVGIFTGYVPSDLDGFDWTGYVTGYTTADTAAREAVAPSQAKAQAPVLKEGSLLISDFGGNGTDNVGRLSSAQPIASLDLSQQTYHRLKSYSHISFTAKGAKGGEVVKMHVVGSRYEYTETYTLTSGWTTFTSELSGAKKDENGISEIMSIRFDDIQSITFTLANGENALIDNAAFIKDRSFFDEPSSTVQDIFGGALLINQPYPNDNTLDYLFNNLWTDTGAVSLFTPSNINVSDAYIPYNGKMISPREFKGKWSDQEMAAIGDDIRIFVWDGIFLGDTTFLTVMSSPTSKSLLLKNSPSDSALVRAELKELQDNLNLRLNRTGVNDKGGRVLGNSEDIKSVVRQVCGTVRGWEADHPDLIISSLTIRNDQGLDKLTLYPNGYTAVYDYETEAVAGQGLKGTITIYDPNGKVFDRADVTYRAVLIQPTVGLVDPHDNEIHFALKARPTDIKWQTGTEWKFKYSWQYTDHTSTTVSEDSDSVATKEIYVEVGGQQQLVGTETIDQLHGLTKESTDYTTGKTASYTYVRDYLGRFVIYTKTVKDTDNNVVSDLILKGTRTDAQGNFIDVYQEKVDPSVSPVQYVIMIAGQEYRYYGTKIEKIINDGHGVQVGTDVYEFDAAINGYKRTEYTRFMGETISYPSNGKTIKANILTTKRDNGDGNEANDEAVKRFAVDAAGREAVRFYGDQVSVIRRDAEGKEIGADIYSYSQLVNQFMAGEQTGYVTMSDKKVMYNGQEYGLMGRYNMA